LRVKGLALPTTTQEKNSSFHPLMAKQYQPYRVVSKMLKRVETPYHPMALKFRTAFSHIFPIVKALEPWKTLDSLGG
jgi:hypothetical protein